MTDAPSAHFDYGGLVADGAEWSPEPEGEEREGFNLRAPKSLLAKVRAAADVETRVWKAQGKHGDVSVNGLIVFALKRYFGEYEKAHGPLPAPAGKRAKGAAATSAELEQYAAGVARKRR